MDTEQIEDPYWRLSTIFSNQTVFYAPILELKTDCQDQREIWPDQDDNLVCY